MANSKGSTNTRSLMYSGKNALLPPKSPFPSISPAYTDYVPSNLIGSKAVQKPREGSAHHQRTSSESLIIEEQPSWLDDLLNEPETPVRRVGHRRSSSDSSAYVDVANVSSIDYAAQDVYRYENLISKPSWGTQDFDYHGQRDTLIPSFYADANLVKQKNKVWNISSSTITHQSRIRSPRDKTIRQGAGSMGAQLEAEGVSVSSVPSERQDSAEITTQDAKAPIEEKDGALAKPSASESDTKHAKQQFAQRSRVRKLQYIAELERNVQGLQAEGSEVSAELEFLNQQNLILSMENKALKQRLESLTQEQLIKYLEHEVLEKEIGRLRALYQQQQQSQLQQQSSSSHRRTSSRDLDSQFADLSLKRKTAGSGCDPITGPLHS